MGRSGAQDAGDRARETPATEGVRWDVYGDYVHSVVRDEARLQARGRELVLVDIKREMEIFKN